MTEIRTLSYLLHPPFLDEAGLLSALRWYGAGFADRSGIKVDLDLPDSFERLPLDTETALFRVVQESLINIHRHARSQTARIRLRRDAETLLLEIADQGRGIPKGSLEDLLRGEGAVGVGIAGMSERIEQLGGRLEITSDGTGQLWPCDCRFRRPAGDAHPHPHRGRSRRGPARGPRVARESRRLAGLRGGDRRREAVEQARPAPARYRDPWT